MKKYLLILSLLISLSLLVNLSVASGSVTITSQVLDSSIRPGGETIVFLTLTNPSTTTPVTNLKLYILPGPYLTSSMSYVEMGGLDATASQQTSLIVKADSSATSMTSYILVKATYYVGATQYQTTVNIPITIKRVPVLQIENVEYIPSTVERGSKIILNFNLKNEGDGPARDVRIILNQLTQKFIVEGSSEAFIDTIKSKETVPISFNLVTDPSLDVGTYSIPISILYLDETKTANYSATKYIGLTISGKYNFIVTGSHDMVAPNKRGKIDIEVANAGTQEALFLTLKVLPSDPIIQITPSSLYIGNLKPDDYSTEEFTFKVSENASPGVYPLNLQLTYKDPYGKGYNESFQVDITVSSLSEFSRLKGEGLSTLNIIVIVIVVGTITYFSYRKFKKKK